MTKDEFKNKVFGLFNPDDYRNPILSNAFIEFFSSNICIPKGENIEFNYCGGGWHIYKASDYEYRTKPSDPIYEYKWRVGCMFGIDAITEQYLTDEEVEGIPFFKLEETKQVRV